ncbi:MAG: carboxy terminal-processing peptidase [Thiohalocapsa sp.]|uniref:carboxy terminal-processing peptidase n=1 Tax=Thiohalocapsa sp. TaxID=2497641 RepID=UPI0025CDB565|nr:carboxy terminal-processing peptidase [Thiohalocapsa sp.]MCG6940799.1 carboxy terminal-processing peptidase [Thiohalocapsa sp.]
MAETSMLRFFSFPGRSAAGYPPVHHNAGAGGTRDTSTAGGPGSRWPRHRRLGVLLVLAAVWLCVSCAAVAEFTPVGMSELFPSERQAKTTLVINKVLERFHYRNFHLDDDFARNTLLNYFEDLDPNRSFFLDRDVERFTRGADRLDDDLSQGRLDVAFDIFRVYRMRVDSRIEYALSLLSQKFDFDRPETYLFDREHADWAKSDAELDAIWRKRVKYDFLTLKLADDPDDQIRDQLRKRYEGISRRIHQFTADDVYEAFVNAYTRTLEPHTSYMSPSTSENFDISMRLKLEGIGAVLSAENEYTVIQRTIAGGPARQSGQIGSGDRIVGVAQGHDGEVEDVIGWRLQDVVDKIRGPKGSVVRLEILPKSAGSGGRTREVELVRNEIKLEDQAAHSYVIDDLKNAPSLRIGVIVVPAFYRDFRAESEGSRNFTSTTRDVRRLIKELQVKGISGLVIDLRGNGGGSLAEATSLTGLFIDQGPVVQVKDALGKVDVETDPDPGVVYSGPLAVLVDRNSASASEIFAGAIQDYGRGLIIGEPTFGKGTVQTLIDLDRYVPGNAEELGRLRLTMAEFFRVSGGSTQLKGVEPDIRFDLGPETDDQGERSLKNALPWDRIRPARYAKYKPVDVDWLRQRSAERTRQDDGFRMLSSRGQLLSEINGEKEVSLQESQRRRESEHRDQVLKQERDRFLLARGIKPVDEDADNVDEDALERQQDAIDRIQSEEAARILADEIVASNASERPRAAMRD